MAAGSVATFWAVAFLLISVPGPDWAFTIGAGLRTGSVLPAVGGLMIGYAGLTALVAAGVGALITRSADALTALTVAGGAYLIWHGVTTLRRPTAPRTASGPGAAAALSPAGQAGPDATATGVAATVGGPGGTPLPAGRAVLVRGIGVSGLNPKGLLLFLAVLPQFTNPSRGWPLAAQLATLGLVFTLTCGAFYLCLGSAAERILRTRPGAARVLTRVSGAAMAVIGALLLAERLLA